MFTREELEALSRKEIQQLAIKANVKANQKTLALIDALLTSSEPSKVLETPERRCPLGDLSNHSGPVQSIPERQRCAGAEDALSQQLALCSLSNDTHASKDACGMDRSEEIGSEYGGAMSGSDPNADPDWEEDEGEMDTIRETLAQLLELGFSEEEAQVRQKFEVIGKRVCVHVVCSRIHSCDTNR